MKSKTPKRFCVYALLDPRKIGPYVYGEYSFKYKPFYIGKGLKGRPAVHFSKTPARLAASCNRAKDKRIRRIERETGSSPVVLILQSKMLEGDAYELERNLIAVVGRRCADEGPLLNKAKGGAGSLGTPRKPMDEEAKTRMIETNRESWRSKSKADKARAKARWYATVRTRDKTKRKLCSEQCSKAAQARWAGTSDKARQKYADERRRQLATRRASMSEEQRVRLTLKQCAGNSLRHLGLHEEPRRSIRRSLIAYIDSMPYSSKDKMKRKMRRRMDKLASSCGAPKQRSSA